MKIEELTKQQIVLLCILVAFVSSTMAAIVVVRLMEQAPVTESPTINRVIERTVQQVIPGETKEITRVNTVVVKEEDLVIEAIEGVRNSVVLVKESLVSELGVESIITNGSGLYLKDGLIIADGRLISGPGNYFVEDGVVKIPLQFVSKDISGLSVLKVSNDINLQDLSFVPQKLNSSASVKLGQTAIVVSGGTDYSVLTGSVSSLKPFTQPQEEGEGFDVLFNKIGVAFLSNGTAVNGPMVTTDGEISGFMVTKEGDSYGIPTSYVTRLISKAVTNLTGSEGQGSQSSQTANAIQATTRE
jgi:hypothetical protein